MKILSSSVCRFKKSQTSCGGSYRPFSSTPSTSSLSTTSTTSTSSSTTTLANSKLSGSSINNSNNLLLSSVVVGGCCGVGSSSSSSNYTTMKFSTTSARSKCTMPFHKRQFVPNRPTSSTVKSQPQQLLPLPLTATTTTTTTPPTSSSTLQKLFSNQHQKLKYLLDNNTSSSTTSTSTIIGANFVDNIPNRRFVSVNRNQIKQQRLKTYFIIINIIIIICKTFNFLRKDTQLSNSITLWFSVSFFWMVVVDGFFFSFLSTIFSLYICNLLVCGM